MENMEMLLRAEKLVKRYESRLVVKDISFVLHAGEVLSLLGPNGAGKSTTIGMLYGVVIPDSGSVEICGFDVLRQGKKARHAVGVVPQGDTLDSDLAVRKSLLVFSNYYGITKIEAGRRVDELLERFGLSAYAKKGIEALSGGMKRKLALVRALISKPRIVFLDEPTSGLDPDARQEFWRDVLLLRNQGCAVLLTTHYMEEAERLSDRILLLQEGSQIDEGTPAQLIERHVGGEVIEVSGLEQEDLERLSKSHGSWYRRFAEGFLIGLADEALWQDLMKLLTERGGRLQVKRRQGTLDDVFMSITGSSLDA